MTSKNGTCKSEMKISKAWWDPIVFNLDHTISLNNIIMERARTRKEKRASREREGGVMRCSHISWVPVNDVAEPEVNEARETP
ncbi:hypothetical protein V6N13_125567 [Hibiscus sabdariffa]